jgi:hypothetical protein
LQLNQIYQVYAAIISQLQKDFSSDTEKVLLFIATLSFLELKCMSTYSPCSDIQAYPQWLGQGILKGEVSLYR